ncbi:UPF0481 protein [Vitis vinifera]|uniref:UPF0481 protein n=1 Tax=Vitis vinifera TaxID=29760 RepID=A0A438FQR9_VITVI|nr:UPF0481 protein [Vitis vinifera]
MESIKKGGGTLERRRRPTKQEQRKHSSQSSWPRIPKVPQLLRGTHDFERLYEPRVISIGPYHHGKPHLQPVETIKLQYAQNSWLIVTRTSKLCTQKLESNIEALRKCYDKIPTDDEKLAWMMLLDGCFLLQFIRSRKDGSTVDLSNVLRIHQINFVERDLFLLENQLPFGVLQLIFEGAKFNDGSTMEQMIKNFVTRIASLQPSSEIRLDERSHLLDLLRSAILGKSAPKQERQPDKKESRRRLQGEMGGSVAHGKKANNKAFGSLFETSRSLKLPGSISNQSRFLNIVAYEMCPDAPNDYTVTSYLRFLYELIDHADDVKELRSRHILINHLGSDEDVARIFNEIANDVVDTEVYGDVKARIQKDYNKRVNTCIAAIDGLKGWGGTVFWKHQLHETCGEQLTTAIVVVGAPDMLSGGTGSGYWLARGEKRKSCLSSHPFTYPTFSHPKSERKANLDAWVQVYAKGRCRRVNFTSGGVQEVGFIIIIGVGGYVGMDQPTARMQQPTLPPGGYNLMMGSGGYTL